MDSAGGVANLQTILIYNNYCSHYLLCPVFSFTDAVSRIEIKRFPSTGYHSYMSVQGVVITTRWCSLPFLQCLQQRLKKIQTYILQSWGFLLMQPNKNPLITWMIQSNNQFVHTSSPWKSVFLSDVLDTTLPSPAITLLLLGFCCIELVPPLDSWSGPLKGPT